jgi:hypothetical protein
MRLEAGWNHKNRQKSVFSAQKPKKTVEIRRFSIDFARSKAAW